MNFYGAEVTADKVTWLDASTEILIHLTNACLVRHAKKRDARVVLEICEPYQGASPEQTISLGVLSASVPVENIALDVLITSRMGLRLAGPDSGGATVHVVGNELYPGDADESFTDEEELLEGAEGMIDMDMLLNNGQFMMAAANGEDEGDGGEDSESSTDVRMEGGVEEQLKGKLGVGGKEGGRDGKMVVKKKGGALPVITHKSGLKFQDLMIGSGKKVVKGHNVAIEYVLRLENGKVVDRAVRKRPFKFRLGIGECVKGFDIGVMGMREGGERHLIVPPELGYGNQSPPGIPRNSTLYFDVSVVKAY